jgi:hypothetical protein
MQLESGLKQNDPGKNLANSRFHRRQLIHAKRLIRLVPEAL